MNNEINGKMINSNFGASAREKRSALSATVSLLLAFLMIFNMSTGVYFDSNAEGEYIRSSGALSGDGSESSPYLIASADDWNAIADAVLGGDTYAGKYVKLAADITVTRGIGGGLTSNDIASPFSGTFDGDEHTLTVNIESSALCAAPFSSVSGTTVIKNLKVYGYVKGGGHPGGLVGAVTGALRIENVLVCADVSGSIVGGFIGHGFLSDITVDSCAYTGDLNATSWSGGLMAWSGPWEKLNVGSCTLSVKNWLFAGSRSDSKNFHPIALVGRAYDGGASCTITANVNSWSNLAANTTSDLPAGDTSYKLTAAVVAASDATADRPWMGWHDVEAFPPTEGSFSDAFAKWTAGTTLALLADVSNSSAVNAPSGEHTLDLNGHELKRTGGTGDNNGQVIKVTGGTALTVVGPGRVTCGSGWSGGGIHVVDASSLVLDGCEISGNTGHYGGALYLNKGTITLKNGATVKNNHAIDGYGGSGVYAEGSGTVILEDCTFTENEIRTNIQYAVFLAGNANLRVSGAPVIDGNVYGGEQRNVCLYKVDTQISTVIIDGALTSGAKIGMGQTTFTGTFTSGWKSVMGDADPAKYFTSDNADYTVLLKGGEALLTLPPVASVTDGENVEYYSDLSSAISAWTAGSTLKLLDDVTVSDTIGIAPAPHILDLNGYGIRMTGSGSVINVTDGASLTVVDDSNREHYLTLDNYRCVSVSDSGSESISGGTGVVKVVGGYIAGGQNDWERGGGIFVSSGGALVMNGGALIGNCAGYGRSGGGMYVDRGASVTLAGNAQVVYNFTPDWGGAIALDGTVIIKDNAAVKYNYGQSGIHDCGTLKLSGSPQIFDNELYNSGSQSGRGVRVESPIVIEEPLTDGARIDVAMYQYQTGTLTSGWGDVMGDDDPAKYFVSEDSAYIVFLKNGEAAVDYPPVASVTVGENDEYYSDIYAAFGAMTRECTLTLLGDVTVRRTVTFPNGSAIILDLNGYGIKAASSGYSVITVDGSVDLKIVDSAPDRTGGANRPSGVTGGYITGGSAGQNCGGGVTIIDGGLLTLCGGAISGNKNTYNGIGDCAGGVFVRRGVLWMEGGEVSYNTYYVAGGVGCSDSDSTVHLMGGVIKSNETTRFGSAVWAGRGDNNTFVIGGDVQIVDNVSAWTSDKNGEGTVNFVKTLKLSGDPTVLGLWKSSGKGEPCTNINLDNDGSGVQKIEIAGELTNSTGSSKIAISPIYRWSALDGGQTFVFTKNWGKYMGAADPADYFKVVGKSNLRVIRKDGEAAITGGENPWHPAGIAGNANIHIKGSPKVCDNINRSASNFGSEQHNVELNASENDHITLDGALDEGARIALAYYPDGGVITTDWAKYMGEADPSTYFVSDIGGEFYLKDGEVVFCPPHAHLWEYSVNGNVLTAHCTYEYCTVEDQTLTISAEDKIYDGAAVEATVTKSANWTAYGAPEPSAVVYSGNKNAGTYTATVTVGEKSMSAGFIISPAALTVSAKAQTKNYGESDPALTYEVSGLVTGDSLSGSLSRAAGDNAGDYEITQGTLSAGDNYTLTFRGATLTIKPIDVTVTITGHNATVDYDGAEHSVSGYDVSIANALYTEADFTFSGVAEAAQTDAGTTEMGLAADQFVNTNPNFANVTFNVTDGYVTVKPIDVTVTVTGHSVIADYDGKAHSADGYDAVADSDLYDVTADMTYSGRTEAVRTDAGTTQMGLAPGKFANVNPNFATVTFIVNDGYVKIDPIDVTVTITGHSVTADYDGAEHTVSGYDVSIENPLYTEADFTFSGVADAALTDAGKTDMGLKADQFANINPNFATVTFDVTDGFVKIDPIDVMVTITGHNATADYDGGEHVVDPATDVMEFAVPSDKTHKRDLAVYSADGSEVTALTESDSKEDGTYRVDKDKGLVYIYSKSASTFALGYTPYYNVESDVSLSSFNGTATVILCDDDGNVLYTFEDVSPENISFSDIPKGSYMMTVTWFDGVENTLTVPLTIGSGDDSRASASADRPTTSLSAAQQITPEAVNAHNSGAQGETLCGDLAGANDLIGNLTGPDKLPVTKFRSKRSFLRI